MTGGLPRPHGGGELKPLLVDDAHEREELLEEARSLTAVPISSREASDLVMMGIGAFTPLDGFMVKDDWLGCAKEMRLPSMGGLFWPIPITVSAPEEIADAIKIGDRVALVFDGEPVAVMTVADKYRPDKELECKEVFKTADPEHPGVRKVLDQPPVNLGGPVRVLSELDYPRRFPGLYQRPSEARAIFAERGWRTVAALQLRNPMHNSHAYLAKIAMEVCDGLYIHQLVGKLKPGDIPAEVRVKCIEALVSKYFRRDRVVQGGYPLEMRYAGPREALLHALFRQNYGCTHLVVGRDHAGVGGYYGPFDAQRIFDEIPEGSLEIQPLKLDWTFYCYECGEMASMKTCPHESIAEFDEEGRRVRGARLMLSGTKLRELLSEGRPVPKEFSKPEVLEILREYYRSLAQS